MRLYFIRHGESVANTEGIISNRDLPHPLTENGREQARTLAQKLQNNSITKIFASPILRAQQTAEILSQTLGMPYQTVDALREYDCGNLEGKSYFDHQEDYIRLFTDWQAGKFESRFDGGESLLDIRARFVPFVEQLLRELNANENLALVSHGGALLCALPFLLKNIDHQFALARPFDNTAMVITESTTEGLICRSWCGEEL